jgi:hypothetical protein
MPFWQQVNALGARNAARQKQLEDMNTWRNAIAHQDWAKVGPDLRLAAVQAWRSNCAALAKAFDAAVGDHLAGWSAIGPGDSLLYVQSGPTEMTRRTQTEISLSVGTLVKFMFGGHEVHATVIEDRGPVGAKGRRILRIRLELAATDPIELEVPADDVKLAA